MKSVKHLSDPEVRARAQAARKVTKKGSRKAKMAAYATTFEEQRKRFPRMALPIIEKAERGSLPAAVKLMCLDCVGWVKQEVRDCASHSCPLYPHRPFQALESGNSNDAGAVGMTAALRERIGLPKAASMVTRTDS
ncbi:hypothetical protein AYO40_05050 [Planctomycetaceae bacterium SCGC AG-212-D15]|nr:hypothetical protein AYO40_05050 [Planctomycetaceae bacterium SCGC AG-212-D15]